MPEQKPRPLTRQEQFIRITGALFILGIYLVGYLGGN